MDAAQKMPLDDKALVGGKRGAGGEVACISGYHETVTAGETALGRLPPPGCCTHRTDTHPYPLCETGLLVSPGALGLRASFMFDTHLEVTAVLPGN